MDFKCNPPTLSFRLGALRLLGAAALLSAGCAEGGGAGWPDSGASGADGAELFSSYCASCHGSDGRGGSGPNIRGEVDELSDSALERVILNGRGDMPAISISDADVGTLIDWLRTDF